MAWPIAYGLEAHQLQRQPSERPNPTILLVHDAFLAPSHFGALYRELANSGARVLIPQLPSSSYAGPRTGLEADIRTLIDHGKPEIDAGRDVVVVAHGYGAIPAMDMATRLNQYSLNRPRTGYISRLVLIAGVVLRPCQSWMEAVQPRWTIRQDGYVWAREAEHVFFQDCPSNVRAQAAASIRPQSEESLRASIDSSSRLDIPISYVVCRRSNAIPQALQDGFVRMLQTMSRRVSVVGYHTGHCPFLSVSSDLATLILRVRSS